jgi:hypothetical protein
LDINNVLNRIFGPKRNDITGDWRKLHNEELHNLYSSTHTITIIKSGRTRWVGHAAHMGAMQNIYKILIQKLERKATLGCK